MMFLEDESNISVGVDHFYHADVCSVGHSYRQLLIIYQHCDWQLLRLTSQTQDGSNIQDVLT